MTTATRTAVILATILSFVMQVYVFLHCLVGLVVKASASRAEDPGFESRLSRDFSGVESYR